MRCSTDWHQTILPLTMIPAEDAYITVEKSWKQSTLPPCSDMFPWAHEFYVNSPRPSYAGSAIILRSKTTRDKTIDNIARFRGSVDLADVFMSWPNVTDMSANDISLEDEILSLNIGFTKEMVDLCKHAGVMPFLKTDVPAYSQFHLKRMRNRVMNRHHSASLSSASCRSSRSPESNINPLRRFDLQCAKMIEIAQHILVYCLHFENGRDHLQCKTCQMVTDIIKLALFHLRAKINIEQTDLGYNQIIDYIGFSSFADLPTGFLVVPLNHVRDVIISQNNETRQHQLISQYDILRFNNWDSDLKYHENMELAIFTSATNIDDTIWVGNHQDNVNYRKQFALRELGKYQKPKTVMNAPSVDRSIINVDAISYDDSSLCSEKLYYIPSIEVPWILFIKCNESSSLPSSEILENTLTSILNAHTDEGEFTPRKSQSLDFPSSGSIALGQLNIASVEVLLNTCYLIYQVYASTKFQALLYCSNGYTETSLLLIAYLIFLWDIPLEETLLRLHKEYGRPYFLFHADLQILGHLQSILREFSPNRKSNSTKYLESVKTYLVTQDPKDLLRLSITSEMFSNIFLFKLPSSSNFTNLKGPLPSKILDHLYLGSLEHAEKPELLKKLGITHILSLGERLSWVFNHESKRSKCEEWYSNWKIIEKQGIQICWIQNLEDNGVDPIINQLTHALEFIDTCYKQNGKILVHCMVGVSRSATVCIAECMKRLKCDVMRAYLYVRVRRLNIIIQPHLMFMYELEKWAEEYTEQKTPKTEWHLLCREISKLNCKYD